MAFLGMRGTGDWATDERPKNFRQGILYLYPNGSAPLTALLSKMSEESVDDAEFAWWTNTLPIQGGAVTGIYSNADMSTAYTTGAVAGQVLYVKVNEPTIQECRVGHQVLLRVTSNMNGDVKAKVVDVVRAGASSRMSVKLLEADDNGG